MSKYPQIFDYIVNDYELRSWYLVMVIMMKVKEYFMDLEMTN